MIRRELVKQPLAFLLFTLHQIGWNPDKHWGCERWRVTHHSSPLFTLGLRTKLKWKLALFGLRRKSRRFRRWCRFFWGEEWVKSSALLFTRTNSLYTNTYTIFVKSEECFWKWLIITTDCKDGAIPLLVSFKGLAIDKLDKEWKLYPVLIFSFHT